MKKNNIEIKFHTIICVRPFHPDRSYTFSDPALDKLIQEGWMIQNVVHLADWTVLLVLNRLDKPIARKGPKYSKSAPIRTGDE